MPHFAVRGHILVNILKATIMIELLKAHTQPMVRYTFLDYFSIGSRGDSQEQGLQNSYHILNVNFPNLERRVDISQIAIVNFIFHVLNRIGDALCDETEIILYS